MEQSRWLGSSHLAVSMRRAHTSQRHADADPSFLALFVDTLSIRAKGRDSKGLCACVRAAEVICMTEIDERHEKPKSPDQRTDGTTTSVVEASTELECVRQ